VPFPEVQVIVTAAADVYAPPAAHPHRTDAAAE
jgi:hypothetical protein